MTEFWPLLIPTAGIFILLLLSGFFSGSETALTAVSRARMLQLEKDDNDAARRVNKLTEDRESLIGAILLGNNLVNILASTIAASVLLDLFGPAGVAYATLVMTALVLIFSEVLPKTYALSNPDRVALTVAWPILIVVRLFSPIVAAVQVIVRGALRLLGAQVEGPLFSAHDEIRGHIDLHHQEGGVVKDDRDMLGGVLDLRELTVDDVMVHRKNMVMIDAGKPAAEIVAEALASPHTRLPLYEGDAENIVGVLHARDMARALLECGGDLTKLDIGAIKREAWFVPETTELQDQLNAFREKREHFALVVDEYGALMGLVTLEDILEEIVGEIEDEHDITVEGLVADGDHSWTIDGALAIRDINRALDWNLPDEEAVTVAGLVIHEAQTIPEKGQVFRFHGVRFEILEKRRNQIISMRVAKAPD
ncbi:HlyC/CorC family transporter [Hyphobacterium marinum]|uniref:HlyC/CorC family transporter n=1 Tax=Hyphobacterium marinum TaxID=3116574 RepID=A0ABU7LXF7_9PROT|nr:HlyC/CorC family transporter [Hyphobacterium sp. Y6023]MEE2566256.1 HlyC/CorC family transporter [Hyphobacterium sp. Y6023]